MPSIKTNSGDVMSNTKEVRNLNTADSLLAQEAAENLLARDLDKNLLVRDITPLKLYKRRWLVLVLYVAYMACNSSQWLQYSIIAKMVSRYFKVPIHKVNWTSLVMMACYLPLGLPAANLMNKISLKSTALIGSIGTAAGSWIKVASVTENGFYLTLLGQTVVATSQVLMLSVPQKLSSAWFGDREVSSACSIGVFGFQLGFLIGFFLPPIMVKNHLEPSDIGQDMYRMFLYFAVVTSIVAVMVVFFFRSEPPLPPTMSQARLRVNSDVKQEAYLCTLKRLFTQRSLVGLFVTTGINNGCFNGLSTLLSQIFLEYFPGKEEDAGNVGVTMVVFGVVGSISFGIVLDRTKRFKLILMFMFYMSGIGMTIFTVVLMYGHSLVLVYIAAGFLGTFLCGFTAISFDVATELTYPEPELIIGTIMNMSSLMFTIISTLVFGFINESVGYFWGNIGFIITLAVGATATLPIKFELKRSNAQRLKSKEAEMTPL